MTKKKEIVRSIFFSYIYKKQLLDNIEKAGLRFDSHFNINVMIPVFIAIHKQYSF